MKSFPGKIICTICARAGSKGVKNKNIRELEGKPLIAHTIQQALDASIFDTVAVTTDSEKALTIAKDMGVPHVVRRPDELATDTADKLEGIRHCIRQVEEETGELFDVIVDLDPTSPLREVSDILNALELFFSRQADNLLTAAPARRSPYFNLVEYKDDGFLSLSKPPRERVYRRQDSPRCFDMNASIYIWKREFIMEKKGIFFDRTVLYEMPEERSIDIDSEIDFQLVSLFMKLRADSRP